MIKIQDDLSYYIAGLWEGDGHIVKISDKIKNFTFAITFNKNNEKLANYLLSYIGYGYIRHKVKDNVIVLQLSNQKGLLRIIELLNGKLRTPKIHKFNDMIKWFNSKDSNLNLQIFDYDCSDLFNNSWFAGFTEADACFDIRLSSNKQRNNIAFRYRIDQRMYDPITKSSYELCLTLIANTFNVKLKVLQRKHGSYYHISIVQLDSLKKLILYFDKYNLLGVKSLDFNDWLCAFNLYQDRIKITPELIDQLKKFKYNMNSRRINFFLSHFNK